MQNPIDDPVLSFAVPVYAGDVLGPAHRAAIEKHLEKAVKVVDFQRRPGEVIGIRRSYNAGPGFLGVEPTRSPVRDLPLVVRTVAADGAPLITFERPHILSDDDFYAFLDLMTILNARLSSAEIAGEIHGQEPCVGSPETTTTRSYTAIVLKGATVFGETPLGRAAADLRRRLIDLNDCARNHRDPDIRQRHTTIAGCYLPTGDSAHVTAERIRRARSEAPTLLGTVARMIDPALDIRPASLDFSGFRATP